MDHLMFNQYTGDINKGIVRSTSTLIQEQALSTKIQCETLDKNANLLSKTIGFNANMLNQNISDIADKLEFGLNELSNGIISLQSNFDIAMGKVISQFDMMRSEIDDSFRKIIDILENKRKTDAREHFRDALEFYQDGCKFPDKPQWFADAIKHFIASIESYARNPLAHLHLGHIYHYQSQHQNFGEAINHYRLCYTYGEAHTQDYVTAAQGSFYAGWLYATVLNDPKEAILLTNEALRLDPQLGEAHYNLAKFHTIIKETSDAIYHLKKLITEFDRNYCIKIAKDADFTQISYDINLLFKDLKEEARNKFEHDSNLIAQDIDPQDSTWVHRFSEKMKGILSITKQNTYFGYLDGISILNDFRESYRSSRNLIIKEHIRDKKRANDEEIKFKDTLRRIQEAKIKGGSIKTIGTTINIPSLSQEIKSQTTTVQNKMGCQICGKRLSFWSRLMGNKYCKIHKKTD